jgi:DNA-binding PadR family transcriptional regulator
MPRAVDTTIGLSAAAWAVLGVVAEGPTHGFAVAALLAPDGALGQVWTLPRPMIYREIEKLIELGLVAPRSVERSDRGPARTIVAVTAAGRRAVDRWRDEPVDHVRDIRSALMLKLALSQRAGIDTRPLLLAQHQRLEPQLDGLERLRDRAEGFERLLAQWRLASSRATVAFLDAAIGDLSREAPA